MSSVCLGGDRPGQEDSEEVKGLMRQFSGYKARVYPAVHHKWGDKDIYTTSAPSS